MKCINCYQETNNPKFCSRSCSAIINNAKHPKRSRVTSRTNCKNCGVLFPPNVLNRIFCSASCQQKLTTKNLLEKWFLDYSFGANTNHVVKTFVRKWLYETRGKKCEKCEWAEPHPSSGEPPLEIHHIDGHTNHSPENLQILCPNCHSLTDNYRARNAGKGREYRRLS